MFSMGYMHGDKEIKDILFISTCLSFMLTLVMASNYLLMFLLVGRRRVMFLFTDRFWYQNNSYSEAANKAFIMKSHW
ncbi:MAG: hypothetical protein IPH94_08345 [Saprospiraceae bacterium]|nr:hypothetical protein [Saprospiraceae bacterium]